MKLHQVAAQLYTLRDYLKTPADIAASLEKVADIGYRAVQISGMGPIPEADLVRICRDNGLSICATHENGQTILNEPAKVIARLQALGCRHTAYPYPAGVALESLQDIRAFAARLNEAGKVLAEAGLTLSYHNHHIEFRRVAGKPILGWIYELTEPRYLKAEPDTYWIQVGGGEPTDWCRRLSGRLPLLHMKDYAIVPPDNKVTFAEVGNGNLNWPAIVAAAEAGGCEWFIVEQDTCAGDPFDSLRQSFQFIKDNLCSA